MTENEQGHGDTGANAAADDGDNGAGNGGVPPEAAPELPPATPEERIAALQAERDETKDRMLRIAAEFENWKKRARKAETDAVAEARERVLKDMLEVVDNLERATGAHGPGTGSGARSADGGRSADGAGAADGAAVLKGVNLVLRVLQQKLERYEVRPFDAQGQPFDPRVHEAISRVASNDVPSGAVAAELQKGYRVGERLLRPALVSVSSGPAGEKPSEG